VLPARVDELERVALEVELLRRGHLVSQARANLNEEEARQEAVRHRIESQLGGTRFEIERLRADVERLTERLQRLSFATRLRTDAELDKEEEESRAEEAAWWAEWRERRSERDGLRGEMIHSNGNADKDIAVRQIYRTLARLVHPDLARNAADRSQREVVMRLANTAREARDLDQLRRLLAIWARPEDGDRPRDVAVLRARVAQRQVELNELRRNLTELRRSQLGYLTSQPDSEIDRYIRTEQVRMSRDLATLRMRRRRTLRQLEERRRDLTILSGGEGA